MTRGRGVQRPSSTAAACVALFIALLVLVVTRWAPLRSLDAHVLDALDTHVARHRSERAVWVIVTNGLQPDVWRVVAAVGVGILALRRRLAAAAALAIIIVGAALLSTGIKVAVGRARPHPAVVLARAGGASFPSGHALTAAAAVIALLAMATHVGWRPRPLTLVIVRVVGAVLVAAVSFSRLALGVHYVSDVLAGVLLGAAWALLVLTFLERRA